LLIRTACMMALLVSVGCASVGEGYSARYGLTNPESPPAYRDLTDESYSTGVVGDRYIEEYDRKYREKDVLKTPETTIPADEETQP